MYGNYRAVAERFGLTMSPADPGLFTTTIELSGEVESHPVRIRRLVGMHTIETEIHLTPALDLGLDLTPAGQPPYPGAFGVLRYIGRIFARADLHVGDTELDDAFSVHGDEEARVRTLLEPLRTTLLEWFRAQHHFHLTDSMVTIRRYSPDQFSDDLPDIVGDVDAALALARLLEAERPKLAPASSLIPQIRTFETFAEGRGTQLLVTPLVTWGSLRGRPFVARTRRLSPHVFDLVVSLELESPLGEGFDPSKLPAETETSLDALRKAGHRVEVTARGLHAQHSLDTETYDLDTHVSSAEEALDALERAHSHHVGYR